MPEMKSQCITAIGASHMEAGKPCQDYSGCYSSSAFQIAAVGDGHGGSKYFRSDAGSRFAVETAISCVKECLMEEDENHERIFVNMLLSPLTSEKERSALMSQLEGSIIRSWNYKVKQDVLEHPFTEQELFSFDEETRNRMLEETSDYCYKAYGTTLLIAAAGQGFWFALQIGDGTIVLQADGEFLQPVELDEGCTGTYTTSICDKDAICLFHYAWGSGTPKAILLASDGLDESFASLNGFYKFYHNVIQNSLEDWEGNITELTEYLPQLSQKGSRDDISLAWIINGREPQITPP